MDGPSPGLVLEPYGGRWDLLQGGYVGWYEPGSGWYGDAPEHTHTIKVAHQCVAYIEDWDHQLILMEGGRRSGKTTGALAPKIVICMLIHPGLPGEVLSPKYKQTRNVRKALLKHVPRNWWAKWPQPTTPPITMTMVHGSSVTMLTAADEDSARSEGVAWGAYDERQLIAEEAAANAMFSTSEGDAPFIFETATILEEFRHHHDAVDKSKIGHVYTADSYGNPFTNKRFLELAREFLDDDLIERELHAKWPPLFGRIFHSWDEISGTVHYPAQGLVDATEAILLDRFAFAGCEWYISLDPPNTAGLWKLYDDDSIHLVHEVLVGAGGEGGGVEQLAARVVGLVGNDRAVVVQDPHEHKWDSDIIKLFRGAGVPGQFRFTSLRPILNVYKHAAVRARAQRSKLLISPTCPHAIEVLTRHTYKTDGSGKASKTQCYAKSYLRESKKIQLVHFSDVIGYALYKMWPTKMDYEKMEQAA